MKKITVFLFLLGMCQLGVAKGGEGTGGTDYHKSPRAWFLTLKPKSVKICYEIAPDFGVDEKEVLSDVKNAFQVWANYLKTKHLAENMGPNSPRIATELEIQPKCDDEDLKFYFGIENMQVIKGKILYQNPFGFSETYSDELPQANWSPGFIWIAKEGSLDKTKGIPAWRDSRESLKALILHEVGHVFGNGHVDDTVMTSHLWLYLMHDTEAGISPSWVRAYNKIDSIVEMVPCLACSVPYAATTYLDPSGPSPANDYLGEAFQLLAGRAAVEPLTAVLNRSGGNQHELIFKDAVGEKHLKIEVQTLIGSRVDNVPLFNGLAGSAFYSFGSSYFAHILMENGQSIPIALNYNMDRRKVAILPLDAGANPKPLFVAAP